MPTSLEEAARALRKITPRSIGNLGDDARAYNDVYNRGKQNWRSSISGWEAGTISKQMDALAAKLDVEHTTSEKELNPDASLFSRGASLLWEAVGGKWLSSDYKWLMYGLSMFGNYVSEQLEDPRNKYTKDIKNAILKMCTEASLAIDIYIKNFMYNKLCPFIVGYYKANRAPMDERNYAHSRNLIASLETQVKDTWLANIRELVGKK